MNPERIDAETLAAFLDGQLEASERARVLRILAENPEASEAFADAAHAVGALNADSGGRSDATGAPIAQTRRRRGWSVAIPALIAAGIAAAVVLPRLGGNGLAPADLAARLSTVPGPGDGSLAGRFGAAWDQPGWSVTRGEGSEVVAPARAFRLGARATDVEIALRAQDTTALRLVAADLVRLASGVDGGSSAAAQYQAIVAMSSRASGDERRDAAEALRKVTGGSPWFDLGVWAEAVRVAVTAADTAFLGEAGASLAGLIERMASQPAAETGRVPDLVARLQAALRGDPADLTGVRGLIAALMTEAGR
jgi:anti-sigma factor RsiW